MAIFIICKRCHGAGYIKKRWMLFFWKKSSCPFCKGTGKHKVVS